MARLTRLRNHGAIPERQHDAFLLALLLAVCLNVAIFAVQALLPRIIYLLQLLGPSQAQRLEEEEPSYPFVLVDPSLLDEEPDPDQLTEAESTVTRRATQTEARPDLPEAFASIDEGVDEILTMPDGNPGPGQASLDAPGEPIEAPPDENAESRPDSQTTAEAQEAVQPVEAPELPEVQEVAEQPAEPVETPAPVEPPPEPPPPVEVFEPLPLLPDPVEPPPEPAEAPRPEEPSPEPPPEETAPEAPEHPPVAEPDPRPDPTSDLVDLAMLPATSEGFFDPETARMRELAQIVPESMPSPTQPVQPREFVEPQPRQPAAPARPASETGTGRANRPQPTFKRIGGSSAAGGAPPRRNQSTSVKILDSDASMALLTHRYGAYMRKLAEQLQASLLREIVLSPSNYSRGQVKVNFGISPDGTLTYYTTVYPNDGSLEAERVLSERMLREAAPFDPLTPQMIADENFQKMTVVVNLY